MTHILSSNRAIAGLFAVAIISAVSRPTSAQTLFQQTFDSSNTLSDYIKSSSPAEGQFNGINPGTGNTASIVDGALVFTRTSAVNGAFWRTTGFSPAPTAVRVQFDLNVTGNSVVQSGHGLTGGVSLYIGEDFVGGVSTDTGVDIFARINIGWSATNGAWTLYRGGTNGSTATQTGTQTVSWFMNSGSDSISYEAPNGSSNFLAAGTYDLWIGQAAVFTSVTATTSDASLSEFKFRWDNAAANATISFDNLSISAIPEPSTYALFGGLGVLVVAFGRRRFSKRASPLLPS